VTIAEPIAARGCRSSFVDLPVRERPLIRQVAEWRVWPLFFYRAIALQCMHPTVMKGLEDHSTLFSDPAGRARRTMDYAMRMFFGDDRAATTREIIDLHRHVKGVGYDGSRYHARSLDVWTWVHLTSIEAMLHAISVSCWPVRAGEVERFYRQGRASGALYGIPDRCMPADLPGLRRYIQLNIDTTLAHTTGSRRVQAMLREGAAGYVPLPVPEGLSTPMAKVLEHPLHILMFGVFPPQIRDQWEVRWSAVHQLQFAAALGAIRTICAPLPDRLRMLPAAYRALSCPT
jgi:uncharacterized protein (DUF2236 family)